MGKGKKKTAAVHEPPLTEQDREALEAATRILASAPEPADETALRNLLDLVRDSEPLARHVVRTAGSLPHPFSGRVLSELRTLIPGKAFQKEVRRAEYALLQKGVQWESPETGKAAGGVYRKPEEKAPVGYVSPIFGAGGRLVVLAVPRSGEPFRAALGHLDEVAGIREFRSLDPSEGQLRRLLKSLSDTYRGDFVRTSPEHVCRLFREALARNEETGIAPPQEYFEWKHTIANWKPEPVAPTIFSRIPREQIEGNPYYLNLPDGLMEQPPFVWWALDLGDLEHYGEKLREAGDSVIVLTDAQVRNREADIYEQAVRDLFPAPRRELMKRRLEETAYMLWEEGKVDLARTLAAHSLDVTSRHEIVPENAFLVGLVRTAIKFSEVVEREEAGESDKERSPLILL